jgi:transcriptional regulator GlxA family with amidase domain
MRVSIGAVPPVPLEATPKNSRLNHRAGTASDVDLCLVAFDGLSGGSMAERVKRVIELMQDDPSRNLTLGEMAESVNLSPPYFCYLFKSITGIPPAKYLKSLRMQQAATLLTTTFLSVKEIVKRVGCTDESHFVRDFKRMYGKTPSAYRNGALAASKQPTAESSVDG